MQAVISANTQALEQVLSLVSSAKGGAYSETPQGMTSTIGRHVRHVLDHYSALQISMNNGEIDYDLRSRDSIIETDSALALRQTNKLITWMQDNIHADSALKMKTEISLNGQETCVVESSLKRELIYLLNHTIHHVAYITLVLRMLGITIDQHIGIAPATQSYLKSNTIKQVG
ncbi:MAG: hypothetical protein COC09_02445 [Gammaproteobacteria bacterium]|nr:MAG: hypothetical protein COC09_02445 [Gammaproteobacteria bacterium]